MMYFLYSSQLFLKFCFPAAVGCESHRHGFAFLPVSTGIHILQEWEDMMQPKEVKSLIQQVLYCYGANRKAKQPIQLVFSGVAEGTKTHEGLTKQSGYESWEVQKLPGNYIDTFPKEKLVYLTADAEEKVYNFDPEMIYVIGGIVTRFPFHSFFLFEFSHELFRWFWCFFWSHINVVNSNGIHSKCGPPTFQMF